MKKLTKNVTIFVVAVAMLLIIEFLSRSYTEYLVRRTVWSQQSIYANFFTYLLNKVHSSFSNTQSHSDEGHGTPSSLRILSEDEANIDEEVNQSRSREIDHVIHALMSSPPDTSIIPQELLWSVNQPIPKGTHYLGNTVEGSIYQKIVITLNFDEGFLSAGADFVYTKSVPALVCAIGSYRSPFSSHEEVKYRFLINGELIEKVLPRNEETNHLNSNDVLEDSAYIGLSTSTTVPEALHEAGFYDGANLNRSKDVNKVVYALMSSPPDTSIIPRELLWSVNQPIPKGTHYLGNMVEGIPNQERVISLDFDEGFLSAGTDFVYTKSVPALVCAIGSYYRAISNEEIEYKFLINGEPFEKALQRKYEE